MRRRWVLVLASALLGVAVLVSGAPVASAQTFQLTTCAWSDLSAAVTTANSNGQDDTINLKQGCTYSLGQLEVKSDSGHTLTINGFGNTTLHTSVPYTAVAIDTGAQLTLNRVTVSSGQPCGNSYCLATPLIQNAGTLTINGSTITNGMVGIENQQGSTTLNHTTVSGNYGWGVKASGGTVWVLSSLITGQKQAYYTSDGGYPPVSGGVLNYGTVHISASTISNNVGCQGGGIQNGNQGHLTVFASTISGNVAKGPYYPCSQPSQPRGGGIWNNGTAWVTDSTIANNSASSGGGIFQNDGQISVLWTTLSGNTVRYQTTGGDIRSENASGVLLKGSIIANGGSGRDCLHDVSGAIVDEGYNIAEDATCALSPAKHSLASTPAGLDANGLQDNGGPTQTIALLPSSPAIDFVLVAAPGPAPPKLEQRLFARPDAGEASTDAGAYELQDGP